MDHSPLSRRGALAAVAGSAVALTIPATAHAGMPPAKGGEAPATLNQFLSRLPDNQRFRIVHTEKRATPEEMEKRANKLQAFGDPYSAHGWDTVSAVRLTDVNKAIAANPKSFPKSWSASIPASGFAMAVDASGTFRSWATTTGGSGEILAMEAQFEAVIVASPGTPNEKRYTVSGGAVAIELELKVLPGTPGTNDSHRLMAKTDTSDRDRPPVVVTGFEPYTVTPPAGEIDSILGELFEQWFNENLQTFTHVFAEINLSADGTGDMSWLQPTYCGYALHDGVDAKGKKSLDDSFLAVLNMTENRPLPQTADFLVDGTAIIKGQRAGLNICADRFMAKMVIPAMAASWNVSADNFHLLPDSTVQATSLTLPPITLQNGDHTPHVTNLHIYNQEAELLMDMDVDVNISPGIDVSITCQYALAADLVVRGGQHYVSYSGTLLRQTSETEVAAWVEWTEKIAELVGGAIIPCASIEEYAVADMVRAIVIAAVATGIVELMKFITEFPAGQVPDGLPSTEELLKNAMIPLQWASATEFVPQVAAFNGGMQLSGNCFV